MKKLVFDKEKVLKGEKESMRGVEREGQEVRGSMVNMEIILSPPSQTTDELTKLKKGLEHSSNEPTKQKDRRKRTEVRP